MSLTNQELIDDYINFYRHSKQSMAMRKSSLNYFFGEKVKDKKTKEELYVLTGGHKILFELGSFERKLKPDSDFSDKEKEEFIQDMQSKIKEWKKNFI